MAVLTFHPEKRPASFIYLFPLDGGRRFGTYVIDYAVDSAYLVDYVVADLGKEVVREADPVGGHSVGGYDCTQGNGVFVCPFIAHDSDAADREEDGSRLPDGLVEGPCLHGRVRCGTHFSCARTGKGFNGASVAFKRVFQQAFDEDIIGFPQYPELFFRYIAENPDSE